MVVDNIAIVWHLINFRKSNEMGVTISYEFFNTMDAHFDVHVKANEYNEGNSKWLR